MASYNTNSNLAKNQSYILINRLNDAHSLFVSSDFWNNARKTNSYINYTKYQIKETDLQQKTATFTSPDYIDLTTGLYIILISSPYHENFAGAILSVDYDKKEGLYTYQCQDWSRLHQGTVQLFTNDANYYNILRHLITHGGVTAWNVKKQALKSYKKMLSGLRPLDYYNMGWWGNKNKSNPLKQKKKVLINGKTYIEAIRDIVYGAGGYIKVYFSQNGVIQVEPYSRDEWLKNGVYVTTKELASEKITFDTTNVITGVLVTTSNALETGKGYTSAALTGLDLSAFFGNLGATISSEKKDNAAKTTSTATTSKSVPVHMNTDRIKSSSADKKMLQDIKKELEKKGYKVTVGARNPNAHYKEINKVKKNGIYFTIYGGLCAGTLKEQVESNHFWNTLKKKNARMVIGHLESKGRLKLNKKLTWLPRAHDDNFSPKSFKGWKDPYTKIVNKGIGIANGTNAKQIAAKFPNFPNEKNKSTAIITSEDSKEITNEKTKALAEIGAPIRDFLKMKVTVPLGNKSLKMVHTNMFLYTELPEEFILTNFKTIADAIKSKYSRNTGYTLNRWYIEGVTITNDGTKFSMDLDLNPFPSSLVDYVENRKAIEKAYTDAQNKGDGNTKAAKSESKEIQPRSDGKDHCTATFYLTTKRGRVNIRNLQNKSENKLSQQTIGKDGTNYANFVKSCKSAKEVYKKLCTKIPRKVASYADNKYKCASDAFNHCNNLNCAERSRLFKACCDTLQIPCVIYHVEGHYMNGVLINGKWETADLCYRSGVTHKDYNTAKFNK